MLSKFGKSLLLVLTMLGVLGASHALCASVTHLQVRIATGDVEMPAGGQVELRIYEAGKSARRVPLTHGESWPRDSTRVIPVTLPEALDPRTVVRFGLYYRGVNSFSAAWEVLSAEVDLEDGSEGARLLNATLAGVIDSQGGELASGEREAGALLCTTDADCDDHRQCNGHERCAPHSAGADSRGCVRGQPVICPVNQVCTEDKGCRGLDGPVGAARAAP